MEEIFESRGIDYTVRVEPFGRTLLGSVRNGVSFYVAAEQADACAAMLVEAGLSIGVVARDRDS